MLFQELPDHLARMALFKVNTGYRDRELCGLWDDEVKVPELDTSGSSFREIGSRTPPADSNT